MNERYIHRWLADKIRDAAEFAPVIVLSGARQTGKSTLLKNEDPFKNWRYISLDDLDALALADKKPEEILDISKNIIIDEAQKSPSLLNAVKMVVDKDRTRRIVLSGSANLLLMKKVSESLAGRAIYFNLMPFAHRELLESKSEKWFSKFTDSGILTLASKDKQILGHTEDNMLSRLFRGFLPPAVLLKKEEQISMWWRSYIKTYLERDLRELAGISNLPDFRKIMELLALRTSCILRQSEISRDAAVSQATTGRYINILETTNLFLKLRPYSKNISQRLIKSPKAFFIDTGLAASVAGFSSSGSLTEQFKGALLESYVLLNLIVRASITGGEVFYFRTQGGTEREIDFILERDNKLIAVEVKLSDKVSIRDISNILFFKDLSNNFAGGLVVYAGKEIQQLGKNIFAVPCNIF